MPATATATAQRRTSANTYVLGINAYDHDVSACLLRNGEIACAISKERLTREKHDTGFFQEVIDYCLSAEGIALDDVALIVRNCYVLPLEDLETRLLYEDIPEFMSPERCRPRGRARSASRPRERPPVAATRNPSASPGAGAPVDRFDLETSRSRAHPGSGPSTAVRAPARPFFGQRGRLCPVLPLPL